MQEKKKKEKLKGGNIELVSVLEQKHSVEYIHAMDARMWYEQLLMWGPNVSSLYEFIWCQSKPRKQLVKSSTQDAKSQIANIF